VLYKGEKTRFVIDQGKWLFTLPCRGLTSPVMLTMVTDRSR
jgi:hypothetical protein